MGSTLVTNGKIRSQPVNDNFRDGWDLIEANTKLIAQADAEVEEDGLASIDTLTAMMAAGLSIETYS
jgi:hypothetical protein